MRTWVIRSLLKGGIWGSSLDGTLGRIRRALRLHGNAGFPRVEIEREMAAVGKSLDLGSEELDDLADSAYQQKRSFLVLSLLYPGVDTRNEFHVDHVFPKTRFSESKLRAAGVPGDLHDTFSDACQRLANLQLLEGAVNTSKQQTLPLEWARGYYPDEVARWAYLAAHDMHDVPADMTSFLDFFLARRERMKARLATVLAADIVKGPAAFPPPTSPPVAVDVPRTEPATGRADRKSGGGQTRRVFSRSLSNVPDGPVEWTVRGRRYTGRIERGELVVEDGRRFSSPSAAADAVHGGSQNGWKVWTRGGRPISDFHP